MLSRYSITTSVTFSAGKLRDRLVESLDDSLDSWTMETSGPTSKNFTLLTETRYRYDQGSEGAVVVVGALASLAAFLLCRLLVGSGFWNSSQLTLRTRVCIRIGP